MADEPLVDDRNVIEGHVFELDLYSDIDIRLGELLVVSALLVLDASIFLYRRTTIYAL